MAYSCTCFTALEARFLANPLPPGPPLPARSRTTNNRAGLPVPPPSIVPGAPDAAALTRADHTSPAQASVQPPLVLVLAA